MRVSSGTLSVYLARANYGFLRAIREYMVALGTSILPSARVYGMQSRIANIELPYTRLLETLY